MGIRVVGQTLPDVVGVVLGFPEEHGDVVVVYPVLDLVALAADGLDESALLQEAQLMGDCGLASRDHDGQVANAERPADQGVEDLRARPVAEGVKGADDELEDHVVRDGRSGVRNGLAVDGLDVNGLGHTGNLSESLCNCSDKRLEAPCDAASAG